ncbi:toprim domain-containing protein [Dyadobacter sp.]|uniref:toprim domain-containing protein n=1 Tax=Dyadobacter sp. TaxID=1914288 RepID=UPI003F718154
MAKIKEFDMVDYLFELGIKPVNIRNVDHWYLSPFRNERTASFKINRQLNRWYDHGIGMGGNLVDFAIMFYQCSIREVVRIFSDYLSFHQPTTHAYPKASSARPRVIEILSTAALTSPSLTRYIASRCIPQVIAANYCQQVHYKVRERQYFALGLKNDSGGYELRNSFAKVASSPKDITTIQNGAQVVCVFEGFFDFLSYKTITAKAGEVDEDYVILNSISFFTRTTNLLDQYEQINLYLDNDQAGFECCSSARGISEKYKDGSSLYEGFKDLNEWLISKTPKMISDLSYNQILQKASLSKIRRIAS